MAVIKCPDCGKIISTRFPMHECTSLPEAWKWAVKKLREELNCVAIVERSEESGRPIHLVIELPNGHVAMEADIGEHYEHIVQFIIDAFRKGYQEVIQ